MPRSLYPAKKLPRRVASRLRCCYAKVRAVANLVRLLYLPILRERGTSARNTSNNNNNNENQFKISTMVVMGSRKPVGRRPGAAVPTKLCSLMGSGIYRLCFCFQPGPWTGAQSVATWRSATERGKVRPRRVAMGTLLKSIRRRNPQLSRSSRSPSPRPSIREEAEVVLVVVVVVMVEGEAARRDGYITATTATWSWEVLRTHSNYFPRHVLNSVYILTHVDTYAAITVTITHTDH